MAITDYQAKYLAYELTRQAPSNSVDKLAAAVASAQVDLNPHQVDAALFAFKSPLSKGALLADEVGLGKTIEAGLVLSQHWAELKRRLLVICPANLRKQWHQELSEKFFLPCRILEKKSFDAAVDRAIWNPFDGGDAIVICSIEFARNKASAIATLPWDLIVIDEAHRLRNVWKPDNKVASAIKAATRSHNKLLLTATPLQNSLLELYGLISIIDEHAFGDIDSFREQYLGPTSNGQYAALRKRLQPLVIRTLRRQVRGYVPYTNRRSLVEPFMPDDQEDALYDMVSEYLRRPNLQALPKGQRSLITMTLRKLLASSTFAIAGAMTTMSDRLKRELKNEEAALGLDAVLAEDVDLLDVESDEWNEASPPEPTQQQRDVAAIRAEIGELDTFRELALGIETNAKGEALLRALKVAMEQVAADKAPRKAIIFTESRKTQDYLQRILADTEWGGGIVLFNGQNNDPKSREIYKAWLAANKNTDRIVDSAAANMRAALVDYFRTEGEIMIATEAAAEGINLQFCALVINYDLPWNPQRIEQRIGRCHRYGQTHDVVVVNFLNQKNEADQRVYTLLNEKFRLFDGVFGASDDPLGTIDSGIDIEKRIFNLYQNCRTSAEIDAEYKQLQRDMAPQIDKQMVITNQKLLEHFDDEVREKLRIQKRDSQIALDRFEDMLMTLTRYELREYAVFTDNGHSRFELGQHPYGPDILSGPYELPRRSADAHIYRLNHPLAQAVTGGAKMRDLPPAEVAFTMTGKVSALESFTGSGGVLSVDLMRVVSLGQTEEHLILAAVTDDGQELNQDLVRRLLRFPAQVKPLDETSDISTSGVDGVSARRQAAIVDDVGRRNLSFFEEETDKLDSWADDLKNGLEREIKEIDRQIRETRKRAKAALTLDEKLAGQKEVKALESRRATRRRSLFEAQDEIDARRDALISDIERKLGRDTDVQRLFTIRWRLGDD